jgi:hypothetical protein
MPFEDVWNEADQTHGSSTPKSSNNALRAHAGTMIERMFRKVCLTGGVVSLRFDAYGGSRKNKMNGCHFRAFIAGAVSE